MLPPGRHQRPAANGPASTGPAANPRPTGLLTGCTSDSLLPPGTEKAPPMSVHVTTTVAPTTSRSRG